MSKPLARLLAMAVVAVASAVGLIAVPASAEPLTGQPPAPPAVAAEETPAPDPSATPSSPPPNPCTIISTATPSITTGPSTPPPMTAPPLSPPPTPAPCPGAISGRITDDGAGVPGTSVELMPAAFIATLAQVITDADGAYRFASIQPGRYRIKYVLPGGFTQYVPRQTNPSLAGVVTVVSRTETTVNEAIAPHGSMAGRITTSSGAPAPDAVVGVVNAGLAQVATVLADDDGAYTVPYLPAGSFSVYVGAAGAGAPHQWVRQHKNRADADPVTIVVGERTTVDERLLPLGRITGTLTNAGAPVTGAVVTAESQTGDDPVVVATQLDGSFTIFAYTGTYKVRFDPPSPFIRQWANEKESEEQADPLTLGTDATVVLDEEVLPVGTARGLVTDWTGQPVMFAGIQLQDPANDRFIEATSDANGVWFAFARPGTYKVQFSTQNQVQWAHDKLTATGADPVTILAGQTTTVDESFLRPGAMTVNAVEERTGVPVAAFCATADSGIVVHEVCTDDGTAELADLGPGTYTVTVDDFVHLRGTTTGVRVISGQTTAAVGTLRLASTVEIAVVDARTGEPVDGICANTTPVEHPEVPGEGNGNCATDGVITLTRVIPDRYNLFVSAFDGVHGSQWVGPNGGVGAQAKARVITARGGVTTRLTVRLDGRGGIAGTITDRATGRPVEGALVGVMGGLTSSDADGRYVIDSLGPYPWVLFFGHDDYAGQWSGGGNNRLTATAIRVSAGQTTTYDTTLRKGTTLAGTVTRPGGEVPDFGVVTVVNAKTLDTMGYGVVRADGSYVAHVLGPQDVRLMYQATYHGPMVSGWYRNAVDFAHATTVRVPATGTKRIAIITG